MMSLSLRIPPLVQVFVLGLAMYGLKILFPQCSFESEGSMWVTIAFAILGVGVLAISLYQCWAIRTTVDPRLLNQPVSLVTSGIYAFTRNPMYVGFFCILAAWASFLSHFLAFGLLPMFVLYMNRFQIRPEEAYLETHFPDEFRSYKDNVRRWI